MNIKHGDWLFSCRMRPMQFDRFDDKDPDSFVVIDGGWYSVRHCSLVPVSEAYAKWFIENEIWKEYEKLYEANPKAYFDEIAPTYEEIVKRRCAEAGLEYEGI